MIQNPGFLSDHPQNWTTCSFCHSRHSLKISEKSFHNFLSYLANTHRQTNSGKNITSLEEVISEITLSVCDLPNRLPGQTPFTASVGALSVPFVQFYYFKLVVSCEKQITKSPAVRRKGRLYASVWRPAYDFRVMWKGLYDFRYWDTATYWPKIANFAHPSHLAPLFGVTHFEFMEKLYGSWNYSLPGSRQWRLVILA